MKINNKLYQYIEDYILPEYNKNEAGHGIEHIKYVIERSIKFANQIKNINHDMVYTVAAYHDIGHHIDSQNHEKISADILRKDNKLKEIFTPEEINTMSEAIEDHRASNKQIPRSIYGKIVSSADRNTNVTQILKRTYSYRIHKDPNKSLSEIITDSRNHIIKKFGEEGYAKSKIYFKDEDYDKFLKEINKLVKDEKQFTKKYLEVNNLEEI